jgi:hypothetical protein
MNTCDNMPGDTLDPRYGSICNSIAHDELSLSLSLSLSTSVYMSLCMYLFTYRLGS